MVGEVFATTILPGSANCRQVKKWLIYAVLYHFREVTKKVSQVKNILIHFPMGV